MSKTLQETWLAGVDGCPAGWIAAFIRPSGELGEPRVFSQFADILHAHERPSIIAVDVPIGLPEYGGRTAEKVVRPLLGKLKRSVFPIPSRRAVFAELGPFATQLARYAAHQRACDVAAATSSPSRRITIQAFGLFPKIRELDGLLRKNALLKDRIFETHPELVFRHINDEQPLEERKKDTIGLVRRRQLLIRCGFRASIVESDPPKGAALDDLLDALGCAFVAQRLATGLARPFPDPPERDQFNLPMAIWA
jgi:predicted RNase H-like nuclease